jgi:tRNA pseudouridine synthase 10
MNQPPQAKVFVEGRYRKLVRDLPQTIFYCPECKGHPRRRRNCAKCEGFGKLTRDSVQELIGWVLGKGFGTRKHKFHGAGREDVDVRMLGRGRPFVVELIGPRVPQPDLAELEATINERNAGRIEVEGLHWTEKTRVRAIKEAQHAKRYEALVEVHGAVAADALEGLLGRRIEIRQQTPARVAHRRADKVRERWVEYEACAPTDQPDRWRVTVVTAHGTYVKEAISGEGGQSEPSLGELLGGVECRCLELDVLAIQAEEGGAEAADEAAPAWRSFGAGLE